MAGGVRTLVAWCPDWPLVAVGAVRETPAVVVYANRVVAASPAARAQGVSRGMRMRAAQGRCPELAVHARDDSAEVRAFEPVLAALGAVSGRIEVLRPGACAIAMRGPSRYFGGEQKTAETARSVAGDALAGRSEARIGVADGRFAAEIAARAAAPIRLVPAGETASFLAPLRIGLLEPPDLVDVLARLGMRTLGDFAALRAADVLARFGAAGLAAHRLASGLDERPSNSRAPQPDWSVSVEIDPPAERTDRVAFAARGLADELHRRLAGEGLACARVGIEAETEHGETSLRVWRHGGALSAAALADRMRWQLDGWLNGPAAARPSGGISKLTLLPEELSAATGRQLGFWGGETEADERAVRAAARLQGRLGTEAVKVPERRGGRHPHEQIALVPAVTVELRGRSLAERAGSPPWPGALPAPSPARILDPGEPVEVLDAQGCPVQVSGRGMLSAPPQRIVPARGPPGSPDARCGTGQSRRRDGPHDGWRPLEVVAWSGPWPVQERWWDAAGRRVVRAQVLADDGVARLLALEHGQWRVAAVWD